MVGRRTAKKAMAVGAVVLLFLLLARRQILIAGKQLIMKTEDPSDDEQQTTIRKTNAYAKPRTATTTTVAAPVQDKLEKSSRDLYLKRRQKADDACFLFAGGQVDRAVEHNATGAATCLTPKVGCTYWLSIFRWLHNDTGGRTFVTPFEIPRYQVHYKPKNMKFHRFSVTNTPAFFGDRFRFIFVREPYSRLWSAYVDKFLLPDHWDADGWRILRLRPGYNQSEKHCANDISFAEFVDYVTKTAPEQIGDHYRPYNYLCSPCVFRPHVVGKLETFAHDTHYILTRMNLSRLANQLSDSEQHARHEMKMLIDDCYHELRHAFYHNCTNTTDVARRLWRTFQINGYLPSSVEFPWAGRTRVEAGELKVLVLKTYQERQPRNKRFWEAQKEQEMVEAYHNVSDCVMEKLRTLYAADFAMFDYDPLPDVLYRHRQACHERNMNT